MNLKPLDDRIVVRPNAAEERTASGLVIPDTAKEKPQQGTVLAVGPGRWSDDAGKHHALAIKEGDTVCTRSTAAPKSPSKAKIF